MGVTDSASRVAIVTGAVQGIGMACIRRFAEQGMRVVVTDIVEDEVEKCGAKLRSEGIEALGYTGDVSNESSCREIADDVLSKWGRIDVLVGNAGVQTTGSLLQATEQDWRTVLGINLEGVAYFCKAVLPAMEKRGSGSIVFIASVSAFISSADKPLYSASKAGLLGLMRSLAAEYGNKGIRINTVCPGATVTELHEQRAAARGMSPQQLRDSVKGYGLLGRVGEPHEIASAVSFLASDEASYITGQALLVDGGYSVS